MNRELRQLRDTQGDIEPGPLSARDLRYAARNERRDQTVPSRQELGHAETEYPTPSVSVDEESEVETPRDRRSFPELATEALRLIPALAQETHSPEQPQRQTQGQDTQQATPPIEQDPSMPAQQDFTREASQTRATFIQQAPVPAQGPTHEASQTRAALPVQQAPVPGPVPAQGPTQEASQT